ncbi:NAD-dependent succinate-semialdehyde dehydrogenase [Rhodococcus sp. IEGM1428]|uniref:NAD-dependent succinate-semialdehyde dehydrogenase n=1 Tax=Rhodococcus sp. IEGM1428 TaxID=3392191 RepID=UPI003D0C2B51
MNTYTVVDPATGNTLREYAISSDEQIESALRAANAAYHTWSRKRPLSHRAEVLRRVARLHVERRSDLAVIIQREMGKPLDQAIAEVEFAADIYNFYADNAEEFLADEPIRLHGASGDAKVRRSALGVLLGIMPWNYPYYQVARFAAPNLVAGNTIVLKHAPQCPESAAALQEIFEAAGVDPGTYVNIYATNEQIARAIGDTRVQGVSLTGSEKAGAAVAEVAGRHLKKVVLELGGSDPFIVLSTDDLDLTVQAALDARMENTGQACNAAKRFIIHADLYDEFVAKLTQEMIDRAPGVAPLSSVDAAIHLAQQVERAVEQGAHVSAGGPRRGAYFPPTVLTGLTSAAPAYREELFGPVATVFQVHSEEEAVELANDTPFGLGSYIFTTDLDQAHRVADRLEVGMVFINLVGAEAAELPFGGVKRSGFGRELGRYGIDEFVNKKLIRTA